MGGLTKQLRVILKKKKKSAKVKPLTLDCSVGTSTENLLSQLEQAQHEQITHLTLNDSLQRPDNVRVFNALNDLVTHRHGKLRQIVLVEPRVKAEDYRRWCFKRTNFVRHVYQECHAREIEVKIQATLLLETPGNKPQDVTCWLTTHFPKTIPQDPDITSLSVALRDVKPTTEDIAEKSSRYRTGQSDVERVFQAMIEVFNNNERTWDFVDCNVLYTMVPNYAAPQTQALLEIAQCYDIPLRVQWEPVDETKKAHGTWTRVTRRAREILNEQERQSAAASAAVAAPPCKKRVFPSNAPRTRGGKPVVEDHTASTTEGSSGALTY